ncbi:acyltransferase family protein [Qipengyuania aquimaris]|uniref:acyltransferase family protein n=1 Tax=Qipengyuania aquimaris TaxID=255984 RepID=UPI002469B3EA|nr:acyltransferase [Qipengyuania aquimaris]
MGRLHSFDLLRGLAAIAVMAYHAERIVPRGYLAVDLFFILSGFVLYRAYADRLGSWYQFTSFTIRRIIRLYPLMLAGAVVGLAINGGSLLTLLLVPTGERVLFPANIPLWSLLYEMLASVLFAALFRYGKPMWFLVWVSSGILFGWSVTILGTADLGFTFATTIPGLFRVGFSFSTGVGLAYLYRAQANPSFWGWPVCLLPLAILLMPSGSSSLDLLAVFVIFPCFTLAAAAFDIRQRWLAAALGSMSYALYAIHHPIVKASYGAGWGYIALFSLLIVIAWCLERFYDQPLRSMLIRLCYRMKILRGA